MRIWLFIFIAFLFSTAAVYCQPCTMAGQTPSTAFRICTSISYAQYNIPRCKNSKLYVRDCPQSINDIAYDDRNPIYYKFTCSTTGTPGFHIDPNARDKDYDFMLFDMSYTE